MDHRYTRVNIGTNESNYMHKCTQIHQIHHIETHPLLSSPLLQAQGVLKDISVELLRHLDHGTAFIQVSTKLNPRGEIRGRVCKATNPQFLIVLYI